MERRIILFLVLSMAVIVLYPYLLEKMGFAKRPASPTPRAIAPKKDGAAPATVTAPAPPSAQILPTPAPSGRMPTPATEGREQEVTVETDLVKVVLSNRGGVIKRWELKRYLTSDPRDPKPIQLVPALAKDVSLTLPLTVQVPDAKLQERLSRGLFAVSGKAAPLRAGQVTWVALQDKYFLAALIPADPGTRIAVVRKEGEKLVSVGLRIPATAGALLSRCRLFVGPKEYDTLAALKLELEETIDFGWFIYGSWSIVRAVAKPLFYAIRFLHEITHNYGVAIILITVFIKLLLAPLAYKSYKSMKDMAAVQPEMMALQKKYADDRERLNKELMKFYKERKVNPVGGCLPMFFQIPVFVALFNILYMTIELRQAPFILWVKDLSVQDPFYVLPILMGVTMFIQQKIQPTTMDPKQAQIMLLLPVFLTFLFISFPAGLVLYWLTNNVLTIAQQVITDRYLLPRTSVPAPK